MQSCFHLFYCKGTNLESDSSGKNKRKKKKKKRANKQNKPKAWMHLLRFLLDEIVCMLYRLTS